jgi:hypothetical protein
MTQWRLHDAYVAEFERVNAAAAGAAGAGAAGGTSGVGAGSEKDKLAAGGVPGAPPGAGPGVSGAAASLIVTKVRVLHVTPSAYASCSK